MVLKSVVAEVNLFFLETPNIAHGLVEYIFLFQNGAEFLFRYCQFLSYTILSRKTIT